MADLFSLADIKHMVKEVKSRYDRLDVLINNAGAFLNKQRETTVEGHEKTITLNLFAPFLLMQSLQEVLAKSSSARVINLSSAMHRRGGKPDLAVKCHQRSVCETRSLATKFCKAEESLEKTEQELLPGLLPHKPVTLTTIRRS